METFTLFTKQRAILPLLVIFLLISFSSGFSQSAFQKEKVLKETNTTKLKSISRELKEQAEQRKNQALKLAKQKGWTVRKEFEGGQIIELMGVTKNGLPLYYITHNKDAAATISTDNLHPGGSSGLNLDGTGMIVGEWDGGAVLTNHQEFNNTGTPRVVQKDGATATSDHATHVAGTMIAAGVDPDAKGMAINAQLNAYDWSNDMSEMASEAGNGLLLSNHSYGFSAGWTWDGEYVWVGDENISSQEDFRFGFYGEYSADYDQIAYNAPYYLIVKSAGNDRGEGPAGDENHPQDGGSDGYDCIGYWGNAKNVLTVGATGDLIDGYTGNPEDVQMTSFSSWGPSDDGRIKPDICGNGYNLYSSSHTGETGYAIKQGTSMSAPSVTGSMALLQEHASETMDSVLKAATLKALVIHTADEAGPDEGPDYMFGWGLMNTKKAADVITKNNLSALILEEKLTDGNTWSYEVDATGNDPLVVTVVWTDPPGTPTTYQLDPSTPMLVNDLDVTVTADTNTYYPYKLDRDNPSAAATKGENNVDNVEKIYIENPASGKHTIKITHDGSLHNNSQNFSVIVTGMANVDNDMAAVETYPEWTFTSDAIYPEVRIKNMGVQPQSSFDINFAITDTIEFDTVYTSTLNYSGTSLPSGKDTIIKMPDAWSNPPADFYNVTSWVTLTGDENTSNDSVNNSIWIAEAAPYDHTMGYGWLAYSETDNENGLYKVNLFENEISLVKSSNDEFITGMDFTADSMLMGVQNNSHKLYFINANGNIYDMHSIAGVNSVTGYAFNAQDHHAYITDYDGEEGSSSLLKVDSTGNTTYIGEIAEDLIIGLACDYAGNFYGVSLGDYLYSIDPTTGMGTVIDSLELNLNYAQDIGFDRNNGKLYGTLYDDQEGGALYEIDVETADLTPVNEFKDEITGFAIPWTPGPHKIETYPKDSAKIIDSTATIWARFDVPISEVDLSGITISGATNINATIEENLIKITHDPFQLNQDYDVTIPAGSVQDDMGKNAEINWNFKVVPSYNTEFYVTSQNTGNPVEDAVININNDVIITDTSGYTSKRLANGTYSYTVSKQGYADTTEELTIADEDRTVNIAIDELFEVAFKVTDIQTSNPLSDAIISIDGTQLNTNASGEATIDLVNGTYPYTVTKADYAVLTGQLTINDASQAIDVEMNKYWDVTFVIRNSSSPIQDATVEISDTSVSTDANGFASVSLIRGSYDYKVSAESYINDSSTVFVEQDTTFNIIMERPSTNLTQPSLDNNFTMYPNPTKGIITLKGTNIQNSKVVIRNLTGETFIEKKINSNESLIDLSSLSKGVYILHISKGDKELIKKIILQ